MAKSRVDAILGGEARQALAYTATAALGRFGALLLVPIFWRRLTPADYGAIAITELIATVVGSYIGLSLETGLSRLYYEWPVDERKRRLGAVWMAHWISAVGLGALSLPILALAAPLAFPNVDFYPIVLSGAIYAVLTRMKALVIASLRIERLLAAFAVLNLGGFLVFAGLEIYFVVHREMGLVGYLYGLILSELIGVVASAAIMRLRATPTLRDVGLREVVRYSLPLVPNSILGTISSIIDTLVLQYVAPLHVLGIYSVSNRFVSLIPVLVDALKMSFAPFLYQAASEQGERAPSLIARVRMYYLIPVIAGAGCVALFTEDLVRWIDRAEYFEVVQYVPLLVGTAVVDSLQVFFTSGLLLAKRTDLMWIPTMIRLVAIIGTAFALIPWLEIDGLIASRYVTTILNLVVAFHLSQKYYFVPVAWGRTTAMLAALAAVIVGANAWSLDSLWANVGLDAVIAAVFSVFLIAAVRFRRPASDN